MAYSELERLKRKNEAITETKWFNENFKNGIDYTNGAYTTLIGDVLRLNVNYSLSSNILGTTIERKNPSVDTFDSTNFFYIGFDLKSDLIEFCKLCEKEEVDFINNKREFEKYWTERSNSLVPYQHYRIYMYDAIKNYFRYERVRLTLLDILQNGYKHQFDMNTFEFNYIKSGKFSNNKTIFEYYSADEKKKMEIDKFKLRR
ncbi:hypothetical protein [Fusibacter ferrireducens]|uniref:Uncharacterized protein n=1 Tax=Fusibacter ferrireducens TaxID=2785058 RepID=A0ABS0A046_9FIRM|nr:hypothetical protein [Fusibacter ferrireducens]MBF4696073.1 hypothetical protein [Fusibacter ferrireducens]